MTKPNKRAKSVEAWGIKSQEGHLSCYTFPSKDEAQYDCVYDEDEPVKVRITEIVPTSRGRKK
jgi:hypothetical protein